MINVLWSYDSIEIIKKIAIVKRSKYPGELIL